MVNTINFCHIYSEVQLFLTHLWLETLRGHLNIKMTSYQYRDSYYQHQTWPSSLHNGNPHTWKERPSLYWDRVLETKLEAGRLFFFFFFSAGRLCCCWCLDTIKHHVINIHNTRHMLCLTSLRKTIIFNQCENKENKKQKLPSHLRVTTCR